MNLQEAKNLKAGDILNPNIEYADSKITIRPNPAYCYSVSVAVFPKGIYNSDKKTLLRYTVTSVKIWKRNPEKIIVRAKRGLYDHIKSNENTYEYIELNENIIKFLVKS